MARPNQKKDQTDRNKKLLKIAKDSYKGVKKKIPNSVKQTLKTAHRRIPGGKLGEVVARGAVKAYKKVTKKKEDPKPVVKTRKSTYEMKQAERQNAMRDRARARHKAWKEERAKKKEARKAKRQNK